MALVVDAVVVGVGRVRELALAPQEDHARIECDRSNSWAECREKKLGTEPKGSVMAKLEAHRTILQADLTKRVVLKYTPHLVFHLDDSIERGTRIIEILQKLETPSGEKK